MSSKAPSRVIKTSYSGEGRGRKEGFKGRKNTLFRKGEGITKTGACAMTIVYQPHRKLYHLHISSNSPHHIWPFSISDFIRQNAVEVVTVQDGSKSVDDLNVPPLPDLDVSESLSDVSCTPSNETTGMMEGWPRASSKRRRLGLLAVQEMAKEKYKPYELTLSPLDARPQSKEAKQAKEPSE